jgi:KUP system potassium uptake protein
MSASSSADTADDRSASRQLMIAALGVVFGDIGTSPLYAFRECLSAEHGIAVHEANILGLLSLILWSLLLVISVKYVGFVLRADNRGEGGVLALSTLLSTATKDWRLWKPVSAVGVFGAALFFGDGFITPAISVLSAMEGLTIATPRLEHFVLPGALLILVSLFLIQRRGTGAMGRMFGPITLIWFITLALLGLRWIVTAPHVLLAINPLYAVNFFIHNGSAGFVVLASVFLAVTGGEALYADMGHFGRTPIRRGWFLIVLPALVLNYFGQGAMLLETPDKVRNPFYEMAPEWALYPLIGLATCAAVIASQALISAAFSVTKQAIQLGYIPRLRLLHTSVRDTGQIYVPFVNWSLYVCIVGAVLAFGSSSRLAAAYGITVTIDMLITTIMTFFVVRYGWKYPWALCFAATGFFFLVDLTYFAANIVKVFEGGWFPLVIGAVMFLLLMTWKRGRHLMAERLRDDAIDLKSFLQAVFVNPPTRVAGTAVFLVSEPGITPNALLHNLKHNKVLHETNLFVTVKQHEVPWIGFDKRGEIEPLGRGCWQVTLHFGFKNEPDVPEALALLQRRGIELDPMETSYLLSRDIVMPTRGGGMADWRERLFAGMHRNAAAAADFLSLPTNRVVELGSKLEI